MAIPANGRYTAQSIKQFAVQEKIDQPGKVIAATLALSAIAGDKSLKFTGKIGITADGVEVGSYDVAAPGTGAVQRFADVDTAIKVVSGVAASSNGMYSVAIATGSLLDKSPPADLVKAQAAEKVALTAQLPKVAALKAKVDGQLALMVGWESGNSLQVAKKAEETARAAVFVALTASINARIAMLP